MQGHSQAEQGKVVMEKGGRDRAGGRGKMCIRTTLAKTMNWLGMHSMMSVQPETWFLRIFQHDIVVQYTMYRHSKISLKYVTYQEGMHTSGMLGPMGKHILRDIYWSNQKMLIQEDCKEPRQQQCMQCMNLNQPLRSILQRTNHWFHESEEQNNNNTVKYLVRSYSKLKDRHC